MNKFSTSVEIRVQLNPDHEDGSYCAVVMDWGGKTAGWFNTGIVRRTHDPIESFMDAYAEYKSRKEREPVDDLRSQLSERDARIRELEAKLLDRPSRGITCLEDI